MNYLQLINDFIAETQMEDPIQTVGTVFDDTEQAAVWVRDAWVEIQRSREWSFRWAEGFFETVPGQSTYTLAEQNLVSGDEIDLNTVRLALTCGRLWLRPYAALRYADGSGIPSQFAKRPDESLRFHATPDANYLIEFEYFRAPVVLTADTDTPHMQPAYHKAIVWKALENYAREQGNEWRGLYETSIRNYNAIYSLLLNRFLPEMGRPVPLQR